MTDITLETLSARIDELERDLEYLEDRVIDAQRDADDAKDDVEDLRKEVAGSGPKVLPDTLVELTDRIRYLEQALDRATRRAS